MSRKDLNNADKAFMDFMQGGSDDGFSKRAVELDKETEHLLGIPSVSPSILQGLEDGAANPQQLPPSQDAEDEQELEEPQRPEEQPQELQEYEGHDAPAEADETPEPELPRRDTHGRIFRNKRSHPLEIYDVLNMRYRTAWPAWEPETLQWSLRRDFGPVGELAQNKIQALGLAAVSDMPWLDWDVFENSGLAWNDIVPLFGAYQPMTPMQIAFAVHVFNGVRPEPFANEVSAYIAGILEEHGWVYAPEEWFAGAQELINRKTWLVGLRTDVKNAWPKIQNVDPAMVDWDDESPLDMHLLKMLVVKRYLDERAVLRRPVPGMPAFEQESAMA